MLARIKNKTLFVALYLSLYGPRLIFIDIMTTMSLFFFILFLFNVVFQKLTIKRNILLVFFQFTLILSYNLFISVLFKFPDILLLTDWLKSLVYLGSSYMLVVIYHRFYRENAQEKLLQHIVYSTTITAGIVLILFASRETREMVLPLLDFKMAESRDIAIGLRGVDLSMGGGTALSVIFLVNYILVRLRKFTPNIKIRFEILLLLFLGSFVTARTGFYALCIFEIAFSLYGFSKKIRWGFKPTIRKSTINRTIIYLPLGLAFITYINSIIDIQTITENFLPWIFESFYNLASSNKFESASTDNLVNDHYFLPDSLYILLFGSSDYNNKSDVGYIKFIFSIGLIGLFATIIAFLIIYFQMKKKRNNLYAAITMLYLWIILLINFKELYLMNSRTGFVLLMIWYTGALIFDKNFQKRENESLSLHGYI